MSSSAPNGPSGSNVFHSENLKKLAQRLSQQPVVGRVRTFLDGLRTDVKTSAREGLAEVGAMAERLARRVLAEPQSSLRPIINATGVLCPRDFQVPLADAAVEALALIAHDYAACETTGEENSRHAEPRIELLLRQFTGAQAALVFTSPGAAMLASLAALASSREVVVARGQVGDVGDLQLTDAASQAAVRLVEVGAAHQVSIEDYRQAITQQTSAIVRLVPADYALVGRTSCPDLASLVSLAVGTRTPVIEYLEAATLVDFARLGSTLTTVVGQSIVAGADLVIFSGQRCVGGPNCGIVVGSRALIERISAHPLYRALEADRLAMCALEATLRLYRDPAGAEQSIPLYQLLAASVENLRHRASRIGPQIERCAAVGKIEAVASAAHLGSGRLPGERISSWSLAIEPVGIDAVALAANLRTAVPAVWADVEEGRVMLNLRGVLARQDEQIVAAFQSLGLKPSPATVAEDTAAQSNPAAREAT